jgi:hypothetical protein
MVLLDVHREVVIALVWLIGSRLVPVVLLTSSRLRLRGYKELLSALLYLLDEVALTRGVGRFLVGGAVGFAWLVERCIKGVFALLAPMTVAGSPRASLVSRRSL